ncbi:unnamed protein product [Leptidea sinapis]|uniref:Uncharacterized protein n=1 Tax=Leptidea sinapis TaxID=189913 RepID=A0A5E4PM80_9NEOP|nr:unnamed protein product [Leptidea sinapis]
MFLTLYQQWKTNFRGCCESTELLDCYYFYDMQNSTAPQIAILREYVERGNGRKSSKNSPKNRSKSKYYGKR